MSEERKKGAVEEQKQIDPMEMIRKWGTGTMQLYTPIQDGQNRITALKWDFLALTGREYAEAMDMDPNARAAFSMTSKQALCLFAEAAAKATGGLTQGTSGTGWALWTRERRFSWQRFFSATLPWRATIVFRQAD